MKYATNAEFLHANWASTDILMPNLLQESPGLFPVEQLESGWIQRPTAHASIVILQTAALVYHGRRPNTGRSHLVGDQYHALFK